MEFRDILEKLLKEENLSPEEAYALELNPENLQKEIKHRPNENSTLRGKYWRHQIQRN